MEYINIGTANSDIVDQGRFSEKKKKKQILYWALKMSRNHPVEVRAV